MAIELPYQNSCHISCQFTKVLLTCFKLVSICCLFFLDKGLLWISLSRLCKLLLLNACFCTRFSLARFCFGPAVEENMVKEADVNYSASWYQILNVEWSLYTPLKGALRVPILMQWSGWIKVLLGKKKSSNQPPHVTLHFNWPMTLEAILQYSRIALPSSLELTMPSTAARHSGLQEEVIKFYRECFRAVRAKSVVSHYSWF